MIMEVSRLQTLFLLVVPACFLSSSAGLDVTVLGPIKDGDEIGLVMVPGAYITGDAYAALGRAIQESSSHKLWVGLTGGFDNELANIRQIGAAIDLARQEMENQGMTTDTIILAGHSLGAGILAYHVEFNPEDCVGLIFLGAVPTFPGDDMNSFPVPFIHITGDIDGMARITSLADSYSRLANASVESVKLSRTFTVLQGLNHGIYATGPMPSNVVNNDVDAEVSQRDAHKMIADVANWFTVVTTKSPPSEVNESKDRLVKLMDDTTQGFIPLLEARDLQGFHNYSQWSVQSQQWIAGVPTESQSVLNVSNYIETNDASFGEAKPSVSRIDNVTVIAETMSRMVEPDGGLQARMSAKSLDCKMKSQEAVIVEFGDGDYEEEYTCKQINEEALQWALSKASAVARQRYQSRGQKMVFGEDILAATGSQWLNTDIVYENTTMGEFQVTSVALVSPVDFPSATLAGMHYCKLMSPYRAIEWIYTDCLRAADPYIIDIPSTPEPPATTQESAHAETKARVNSWLVFFVFLATVSLATIR